MRTFLAAVLLLLLGCGGAHAQLSCTVGTQTTLLNQFSDNAAIGSITPANIRNVVCSMIKPRIWQSRAMSRTGASCSTSRARARRRAIASSPRVA